MTSITLDCSNKNLFDIINWCDEHVGEDNWEWVSQFPSYRYIFQLPSEEVAVWFKLTWQ